MIQKQSFNVIKGMRQDISPSKANPEYIFDARNIRLTARGNDTLLSISNEQGNLQLLSIQGKVLGYCAFNKYLTVFAVQYGGTDENSNEESSHDFIYRISKSDDNWDIITLYTNAWKNSNKEQQSLNLGDNIQTLGVYENQFVQKVYWVDGINQPRVINITQQELYDLDNRQVEYTNTSFDFVPELKLEETVNVTSMLGGNGKFSPGTVQYAFTYYNKYGQESNIFYITDLYYVTFSDRGGSPEEHISNSFKIELDYLDEKFDYLRIYAIHRTSVDATPYVRRVIDLPNRVGSNSTPVITQEQWVVSDLNDIVEVRDDNSSEWKTLTNSDYNTYVDKSDIIGIMKPGMCYVTTKTDKPYLQVRLNRSKIITWGNVGDTLYITKDKGYESIGDGRIIMILKGDATSSPLGNMTVTTYETKILPITFIDNNTVGDSIDPTLLLYIGGEDITASTLSQKDSTLFLGNITLKKPVIPETIKTLLLEPDNAPNTFTTYRSIQYNNAVTDAYYWNFNQNDGENPCTFKFGEHYRLGVQFQYKNGKWSEPVLTNYEYTIQERSGVSASNKPSVFYGGYTGGTLKIPVIKKSLSTQITQPLVNMGFKRVRTIVVNPTISDRKIVLQGMVCPTVYSSISRSNNTPYAQSSWFLRPFLGSSNQELNIDEWNKNSLYFNQGSFLRYNHGSKVQLPVGETIGDVLNRKYYKSYTTIRGAELEIDTPGSLTSGSSSPADFYVDQQIVTFHSPDIEFDDNIASLNGSNLDFRIVGDIPFQGSFGDIYLETSSPTISGDATGFFHKTLSVPINQNIINDTQLNVAAGRSLVSGLFFKDYMVDDMADGSFQPYSRQNFDFSWVIYPWQCSGSLNNDIPRPANQGSRTAVLKRKVISNIKWANSTIWQSPVEYQAQSNINVFNSNEVSLIKVNGYNYYGNVDTLLTPVNSVSKKVGIGSNLKIEAIIDTKTSKQFKTTNTKSDFDDDAIVDVNTANTMQFNNDDIGDFDTKLLSNKNPIRMKYKSTPHIVLQVQQIGTSGNCKFANLRMGELYRKTVENAFGGRNEDALKSNLWIPSGLSEVLDESVGNIVTYLHGDCYYQRYDCLKTYPFTNEDENSIVEIGSFMVETRVNIDGRYDRNRGQTSNINMTPQNFNLVNKAYTQKDNFFNYRRLDSDFYKLNSFPNTITWSKEKSAGEEVDSWTNINMTNTFDTDGNQGNIVSIENYNNELYCFQQKGLSRILFKNRVQVATNDNIPIEISNGYKVQGKVYLSNTVGCQNQKAIKVTPQGIYFSDLNNSGIYLYNQQGLQDISTPRGFTNWVKECQPNKTYYDTNNGDVYFIGDYYKKTYDKEGNVTSDLTYKNCLCFSEKLNEFTSFMDYGDTQCMFNIDNNFYAFNAYSGNQSTLFEQFTGGYNLIFNQDYPYHICYIANQNPNNDKVFNNIEFRGDLYSFDEKDKLLKNPRQPKSPNVCPFNTLTVWNEYQEGTAVLKKMFGKPSNLKEKFRIWRANIPRDKSNNRDRIRNPWTYIKLEGNSMSRIQLHDLQVYYYDNSIYGYGNQRQQ